MTQFDVLAHHVGDAVEDTGNVLVLGAVVVQSIHLGHEAVQMEQKSQIAELHLLRKRALDAPFQERFEFFGVGGHVVSL